MFYFGQHGIKTLIYDDVNLAEVFEIEDLQVPAMPQLSAQTLDTPGMAGLQFQSRVIGSRTFKLRLRFDAKTLNPLTAYEALQEKARYIFKSEPKRFYIQGDKYVNAIAQGTPYIEQRGSYGVIEIEFVCFDPYIYGEEKTHVEFERVDMECSNCSSIITGNNGGQRATIYNRGTEPLTRVSLVFNTTRRDRSTSKISITSDNTTENIKIYTSESSAEVYKYKYDFDNLVFHWLTSSSKETIVKSFPFPLDQKVPSMKSGEVIVDIHPIHAYLSSSGTISHERTWYAQLKYTERWL